VRALVATVLTLGVATALAGAQATPTPVPVAAQTVAARQLLDQYCVSCHNARATTAATQSGVVLDTADVATVGGNPALWEKVLRRLHAGTMPPQGARQPDSASLQALTTFLESALDREADAHPHPGRSLLHRLNRTEYANAVRDLLALDIDVAALLPPDDSAYGFDNVADALSVSPSLLERYAAAADGRRRLDPTSRRCCAA